MIIMMIMISTIIDKFITNCSVSCQQRRVGCHWGSGGQENNGIISISIIIGITTLTTLIIIMTILVVRYHHYQVYWVGEGIQGLQGKLTRWNMSWPDHNDWYGIIVIWRWNTPLQRMEIHVDEEMEIHILKNNNNDWYGQFQCRRHTCCGHTGWVRRLAIQVQVQKFLSQKYKIASSKCQKKTKKIRNALFKICEKKLCRFAKY